jgi:DNA-binding transcriptional LysR family regulator
MQVIIIVIMMNMQQSIPANLDEIRAFVAIATSRSLVAAGKMLGRDPAMMSRRLKALEARLGVRLAERTTRLVTLTEAGEAYLARVSPVLLELDAADREAATFGNGEPNGHLRISLPGSFGRMWFGPIISGFLAEHPRVTVEADATNRFVDLIGERYDLAIRLGELPDSRLVARKLADRRRLLCASPAYLARAGTPQSPQDLVRHDCLCFTGRTDPYRWSFRKADGSVTNMIVSARLASTEADILVDAAIAGLGILHTTDWYVGTAIREGRLVEVLADWPLADRGAVYVMTPASMGTPSKTRAFSNWTRTRLINPPWALPR